ncbi:MAG: efflux RND transporter periplasmic adaptor subunit [Anaerolineales bacterium]|nr:efflux RND transporter periplasmic adaptor subunit [Anaerolineales bacterium]
MKKIVYILFALVALGGAAAGVWFWQTQQAEAALSDYELVAVSRGNLTASIGATGVVHSNQVAILKWQTSGTVDTVNVEVGDMVRTDQALASLVQTTLPQNVILAQVDLNNAQKALNDLKNSQVAQAQALQAVEEARKAVIEAERIADTYEEDKYQDKLEDAEDDVVDLKEDLDEAIEDFEPYQDLDPENSTRKNRKEDLDEAQRDYDEAVRKRDLLILEKEMALSKVETAKAKLADAQREYDRLKNGPDPQDIANLEARIAAAQATLNLARIVAPFDGTITDIQIVPGDQVASGAVAFQIDDLSRLLVDVKVSEVDINRIQLDQEAILTFDAIQGQEYNGLVIDIDRVGVSTQGVVDFIVTVELTNADENVKPGMTAAVNILVDQVENVIQVPNRAVRIKDGKRVVYVLRDNQLTLVEIKLGASSEQYSQVLDGALQAGEQIVLNPPQEFETNGPPPFVR